MPYRIPRSPCGSARYLIVQPLLLPGAFFGCLEESPLTASMHSLRRQKRSCSHTSEHRPPREPYFASHGYQTDGISKASAEAGRKEEHFKHYADSHAWKRLDEPPLRLGVEQSRARRYLRATFIAGLGMFGVACAAIVLVSVLQTGRNPAHLTEVPMKPSSAKTVLPRGISTSELPYEGRQRASVDVDVAPTMPRQNAVPAKLAERDTSPGGAASTRSRVTPSQEGKETKVSKPTTKAKPVAVKEKESVAPRKRPSQAKKRQEFERLQQQAADEMLRSLQMTGH